jgi:hypothetical protein
MRIFDGKVYRDMTPEEINAMQTETRKLELAEKTRPLTEAEVSRMIITQQVNSLTVDDNTALRMKSFYPEWTANTSYSVGFKVQRNDKLWKVLQAHTSVDGWQPENASSLWEEINETHTGTIDDPIPYNGNMRLEDGKHYVQNYVIYLCNRDTINPVYHPLADLVGLYVVTV